MVLLKPSLTRHLTGQQDKYNYMDSNTLNEIAKGFSETVELAKKGENIFDMGGNVPLFPTLQSQAQWKFAKTPKGLQLSDGTHVYNFDTPSGYGDGEEDFPLVRGGDVPITDFGKDAIQRGIAQVHRSDPGSIYFTMQEGFKNPTYTLRHVSDKNWKAIPKKKPIKKMVDDALAKQQAVHHEQHGMTIPQLHSEVMKQGMMDEFIKYANLNKSVGSFAQNLPGYIGDVAMLPERSPGIAAAVGAGGGLAYHLLKKKLYNSPEENEQEGIKDLLKRMTIPAVALGGVGMLENAVAGDRMLDGNIRPGYNSTRDMLKKR